MTYASVADALEDLPDAGPAAPACIRHASRPAISCCSLCGKPLCRECAPWDAPAVECRSCRGPLQAHLHRWGTLLTPSIHGLGVLIGFLLIAYVLLTAHRFSVFQVREPGNPAERTRRCRLYLAQASRSDHYGRALEKEGRRDLARRRYRLALDAARRVLADLERTEYWEDLNGDERAETKAELHIALASFLLHCGNPGEATAELKDALELDPPLPIRRQALFRLGEALESESPAEAILRFRESLADAGNGVSACDDFDRVLDSASLNPQTRSFYLTVRRMAGRFDPAEAQARIVACHDRLGERLQAEIAYAELLERYGDSEQAQALRKMRGNPKAGPVPKPVVPAPAPRPNDRSDEEKITIVPLER